MNKKQILFLIFIFTSTSLFIWLFRPWQQKSTDTATLKPDFTISQSGSSFQNTNSRLKTKFAGPSSSSEPLVSIADTRLNSSISMDFQSAKETKTKIVKHEKTSQGKDSIRYEDVLDGIDVTYEVIPDGIKETIIVKSEKALSHVSDNGFLFNLNLANLKPRKNENGYLPEFYNPQTNQTVFRFLTPFMTDAAGARSNNILLEILPESSSLGNLGYLGNLQTPTYMATVTPDLSWLQNPSRIFPILIDPTVKGNAPVAQWTLDEGYGTTTYDNSGNSNDLTITNATWERTSDELDSRTTYIEFDGTGDYLSRTTDTDFNFGTGSFSITGWFKHNSTAANDIIIAHTGGVNGIGWKVYMNSSGYLCFGIDDDDGSVTAFPEKEACTTSSQGSLADSKWHHFAAVKSSTTSITIYLDGNSITTTSITGTTGTLDNNVTLHVGIDGDASSNAWTGFIDSIAVYNYERTAAQIQADALAPAAPQLAASFGEQTKDTLTDGLIGWWKMDESAANSCTNGINDSCDSSGNSNDGAWIADTANNSAKYSNGIRVDGIGDYLDITDTSTLDTVTTQMTVSLWVKPAEDYASEAEQWFYFTSRNGFQYELGYQGWDDAVEFKPYNDSTSFPVRKVTTLSNGTWYHFVAVVNGNYVYLYQNGQLIASRDDFSGNLAAGGNIYVGGYSGGSGYFNGVFDEVRYYNRALSPSEVERLYNWAPPPVGYWNMDENTGTTSINDRSGNGNNGTMETSMIESDWVPGKFGSALAFDGTDDFVDFNDVDILDFGTSTDFTLETWIKMTGTSKATQHIIWKRSGAGYRFQYDDNPDALRASVSDSTNFCTIDGSTDIEDNTWHHVAAVIKRNASCTTNDILLYVDGVQESTTVSNSTANTNVNVDNAADFLFSRSTTTPLNGLLDDARIYSYARTPGQIIRDMNAGHPLGSSPVGSQVGYWKFDEGYGTTANDNNSDRNNDLTLSSASWTTLGKFGHTWNGTNAVWLSRADDDDFDFTASQDFSITGWFKSDSASNPGATEYLVNKASATVAGYAVYANTSGQICFAIDDDTSWTPDIASCTTSDFYDNAWHHFAAIRDYAATDKTYIYIDGLHRDSDTDTTTATLANSLSLYVGDRDGTDNGDEFAGDLDELKIYRTALTADEVKVEYNWGKSAVLGSLSTDPSSSSTPSNSSAHSFCVPGDTSTCNPPVGWWKMDENTGTTSTSDSSGNGNNGTMETSMTESDWVAGKIGSALNFDGTDDFIDIPEPADNNLDLNDFTISAWFKTTQGSLGRILAKPNGGTQNYSLSVNITANKAEVRFDPVSGNPFVNATSTTSVNDGNWYHLAGVFSNSNNLLQLYLNGVMEDDTSTTETPKTGTLNLQIGRFSSTYGQYLTGLIDDVRIYNYARTPAQIAWDYNRGAPIAWYKMDECTGTTIYNSAKNANGEAAGMNGTWDGTGGTNTAAGTCDSGNTAHAWYNGANGKRNSSLDFDGTDDLVNAGSASTLDNQEPFTVTAWVKPRTLGEANLAAIVKKDNGTGLGHWTFRFRPNSDIQFTKDYVTTDINVISSTNVITLNQWQHVAVTWDGSTSASNVHIYINGSELSYATQTDGTGAKNSDAAHDFIIGNNATGANTFDGLIDDVRFYNYALTAQQVKLVYNNGAVTFAPLTGSP